MRRTPATGNERCGLDDGTSNWLANDGTTLEGRQLKLGCRQHTERKSRSALADRAVLDRTGGPRFLFTAAMANRAGELAEVSLKKRRCEL